MHQCISTLSTSRSLWCSLSFTCFRISFKVVDLFTESSIFLVPSRDQNTLCFTHTGISQNTNPWRERSLWLHVHNLSCFSKDYGMGNREWWCSADIHLRICIVCVLLGSEHDTRRSFCLSHLEPWGQQIFPAKSRDNRLTCILTTWRDQGH